MLLLKMVTKPPITKIILFLLFGNYLVLECIKFGDENNIKDISYAQAELLMRIRTASLKNLPYNDLKSIQSKFILLNESNLKKCTHLNFTYIIHKYLELYIFKINH